MGQTEFKLNRKALFGAMVLAAAGAMPAYAATINVTTTADAITDDAVCSLREAVIAINSGNVGLSGCTNSSANGFGTEDTIVLEATTYTLTIPGSTTEDWYASSTVDPLVPYVLVTDPDATIGDLDLTKSVKIVGAGIGATTIDAGALDRVFQIVADPVDAAVTINVTLSDLTVRNGLVEWQQITAGDVVLDSYWLFKKVGGGIATGVAAAVTQYIPSVHGPDAGAGEEQVRGEVGGDEETGPTYGLTLTNVGVLNNVSEGDAGGIYNITPMVASGLLVEGNRADANGGGLYNEGNSTVTNSTIRGNIAEGGGGLFATGSNTITLSGTTINANRAVGGGAVSGRSGVTINVTNSTLSGNLARDVGAGFYHNGPASLNFATIANNISGADSDSAGSGINTFPSASVLVAVKNVLLAANKKGWTYTLDEDYRNTSIPIPLPDDAAFAFQDANCGETGGTTNILSRGFNLSSDDTCIPVLSQVTDINPAIGQNIDPLIGDLGPNGGPTETHALLPGSPALSKGGVEAGITTDQRGVARETPPDIGAFELDNIAEGGGGGGCAIGTDGRFDPTLPAMLAAALAFFGWRRRPAR